MAPHVPLLAFLLFATPAAGQVSIICGPGLSGCVDSSVPIPQEIAQWETIAPGRISLMGTPITIVRCAQIENGWEVRNGFEVRSANDLPDAMNTALDWAIELRKATAETEEAQ